MAEMTSRDVLEEWLKDNPADFSQVIALRAALRALPYAFTKRLSSNWVANHAITLFRAIIISWAARNFPDYDMADALRGSASAATGIASSSSVTAVASIAGSASAGASTAAARASASAAAAHAAYAADPSDFAAVWANVKHDCEWLNQYPVANLAARQMTSVGLWQAGEVKNSHAAWQSAANRLLALDGSYQVWIDWCNLRFEGGNDMAFDIPGDTDRTEDKAILARLADATNEDFWDKGAAYVNTTLQRWIDEARERVRSDEAPDEPPPPPEAIRTIAAEIASPTITLTNNQLDVITNATFDGQTDTANLDEAIAILRAVVAALLGGLPGNAPRSFAANLTIYDSELAKRNAKPFLGVLVRMEKSVNAGFHADPEMFDAGVATNFISYFEAHLAFLTHYRRNEEREAKIAQFKIDDAAASGVALTGPVDDVAKEVEALAEQGLVTDSYAQAVKEQQEINNQIALYASSPPTISGEPSAKERHILQTVGFYERTLAVTTNIVSVTTQFAAFIIVLKAAIEALLKFFV